MILNRTQNAERNFVFGAINYIIKVGFPFLIRTIIIYQLGVEYQGLNSLFSSILSALSVAELGFDTATVAAMYHSVAKNDVNELCALLRFIKKAYLIVGTVIFIAGMACIPVLPLLIKDFHSIPGEINVYHIYIVFLINSVASYFFGGYSASLASAYQRQDLLSKANSFVSIVFYLLESMALLAFHNYYVYIYIIAVGSIAYNIAVYRIVRAKYPSVIPKGEVKPDDKQRLKKMIFGLVYGKIGGALSTSFDNMIISSFLGISILGFYSNYSCIIAALQSFMMLAYTSVQAGIGNALALDSVKKNYEDLLVLTFLYDWLTGWSSICLFFLLQPLIAVWIGKRGVFPDGVLAVLVLNFYISKCSGIIGTYKNALGIWWEDRYTGIIAGFVNLSINLWMAFVFGRYGEYAVLTGVIISTVIATALISIPRAVYVTFRCYFKTGMRNYVRCLLTDFILTFLIIIICCPLMHLTGSCFGYGSISCIVARLLVCIVVPNILWYVLNSRRAVFIMAKKFILLHVRYPGKKGRK